jgi:hypothetical protein
LTTPLRFNSLGNRGIHTDACKGGNRHLNAFLWTRQFLSIQQTDSDLLLNLSGLLVTPVHILGSEMGAAKCDTTQDHDHHQVIGIHHDLPFAISISASPASGGPDCQHRGAVPSRMIRPCNLKAERILEAVSTLSYALDGMPMLLGFGPIEATTPVGGGSVR